MRIAEIVVIAMGVVATALTGALGLGIIDKSTLGPRAKIAIWVYLIISASGAAAVAARRVVARKITSLKPVITEALDLACITLAHGNPCDFRANVLLPTGWLTKKIKIAFHSSNMTRARDVTIRFEKWQGCAGKVWGYGAPVIADLTLPNVKRGANWGLTPDQVSLTRDLKAVFCVPVRHPTDYERIVGIVCLDTEKPIADFFECNSSQELVLEFASLIGLLLYSFDKKLETLN